MRTPRRPGACRLANRAACGSRLALAQLGDPGLDESLHESGWRRLVGRKPDGSFGGLVSLEVGGRGTHHGRNRVQAAVMFPRRVPHKRSSVELEGWDPVAEALFRIGRRGSYGLSA